MTEYFKLDNRRLSFRECWRLTRGPAVLILWVAKLLWLPIRSAYGIPRIERVDDCEIPAEAVVPAGRDLIGNAVDDLSQVGFHDAVYYQPEVLMPADIAAAAMLHGSGEMIAVVIYVRDRTIHPPRTNLSISLISPYSDGSMLITSNRPAELNLPPGYKAERYVGASVESLCEAHRRRLQDSTQWSDRVRIRSRQELFDFLSESERRTMDFQIERRLYVPMTAAEVAEATAARPRPASQPASTELAPLHSADVLAAGSRHTEDDLLILDEEESEPAAEEHAEVMAEIERLQTKRPGWGQGVVILFISMALFLVAGGMQWSWRFALMLIPILIVHELGHFIAMRIFGYRNLRMFFIPFFGAAVSGRNYNAAGWKKAIVSLAGPVPGILIGSVLGVVGLIVDQPLVVEIAVLTLIVNGFNLLPILPLDGGWVMHAVLFSRHRLLDGMFRLAACVGLVAVGVGLGSRVLWLIAIPMFIGLPVAFRAARITDRLRRAHTSAVSLDGDSIPPETARTIIGAIKETFGATMPNTAIAQHTLNIFESLNARPPGWIASTALFGVYAMSLLIALVFSVVLVAGQQGFFGRFSAAEELTAEAPLACGSVVIWEGPDALGKTQAESADLVAQYAETAAARTAFEGLKQRLPGSASMALLGQSIVVTLPSEDRELLQRWRGELQNQASMVLGGSKVARPALLLNCLAPNEQAAREIEQEILEYTGSSDLGDLDLIPPWLREDPRTDEERAQHRRARQTWLKMQKVRQQVYEDPALIALSNKLDDAWEAENEADAERIEQEYDALQQELDRQALEKLHDEPDPDIDAELIDLYLAAAADWDAAGTDWQQPIAERMGRLPAEEGDAGPNPYSIDAHLVREGRRLEFPGLRIHQPSHGAPALIDWLCDRGCTNMTFQHQSFPMLEALVENDFDPAELEEAFEAEAD